MASDGLRRGDDLFTLDSLAGAFGLDARGKAYLRERLVRGDIEGISFGSGYLLKASAVHAYFEKRLAAKKCKAQKSSTDAAAVNTSFDGKTETDGGGKKPPVSLGKVHATMRRLPD